MLKESKNYSAEEIEKINKEFEEKLRAEQVSGCRTIALWIISVMAFGAILGFAIAKLLA